MGLVYYYLWVFFMYKVPYIIRLFFFFFMYQASYIYGSILCIAPPILHKMVSYIESVIRTIMGPSYGPIIVGSYSCT